MITYRELAVMYIKLYRIKTKKDLLFSIVISSLLHISIIVAILYQIFGSGNGIIILGTVCCVLLLMFNIIVTSTFFDMLESLYIQSQEYRRKKRNKYKIYIKSNRNTWSIHRHTNDTSINTMVKMLQQRGYIVEIGGYSIEQQKAKGRVSKLKLIK